MSSGDRNRLVDRIHRASRSHTWWDWLLVERLIHALTPFLSSRERKRQYALGVGISSYFSNDVRLGGRRETCEVVKKRVTPVIHPFRYGSQEPD